MRGFLHTFDSAANRGLHLLWKRGFPVAVLMLTALVVAAPAAEDDEYRLYSYEFLDLMNKVERLYLEPNGYDRTTMESENPATLAAVVGHALRQESYRLGDDFAMSSAYLALEDDALYYLAQVAEKAGFTDEHGTRITARDLWDIAYEHQSGDRDEVMEQTFGVGVGDMPSVLEASREAEFWQPTGPPSAIGSEPEEEFSLMLPEAALDEPTPASGEEDIDLEQPPRESHFGDLVGTWRSPYGTLTVSRSNEKDDQGNIIYTGTCTSSPDQNKLLEWLGWKPGDVVFKVSRSYPSVEGPVYQGEGWGFTYKQGQPTRTWGTVFPSVVYKSQDPSQDSLAVTDRTGGETYFTRAAE